MSDYTWAFYLLGIRPARGANVLFLVRQDVAFRECMSCSERNIVCVRQKPLEIPHQVDGEKIRASGFSAAG
jgi:hypothetical protein